MTTKAKTTAPEAPAEQLEDRPTLEEMLDSINGYEEVAITKHFDRYFSVLVDDATLLARALIFILLKRGGTKDPIAYKSAMSMRLGEVNDYFADDDEIDPDSPETPAGEGDSQPA